ncbi:hypothetical protein V6N12_071372 [Hibiscus sabdariffa]|uniref:Uncharacterized protein n=1 Tax=Hibiscus sabdariffa TaxID=183260 RepID=A0ABR2FJW4_9ROSI
MVFLLSLPTSRSRSCSGVNGIHVESHTKLASLAGTQDYAVPPPLVDHSKSITYVVWLSHTPLRYVEPYFGGVAMTAYGSQALISGSLAILLITEVMLAISIVVGSGTSIVFLVSAYRQDRFMPEQSDADEKYGCFVPLALF